VRLTPASAFGKVQSYCITKSTLAIFNNGVHSRNASKATVDSRETESGMGDRSGWCSTDDHGGGCPRDGRRGRRRWIGREGQLRARRLRRWSATPRWAAPLSKAASLTSVPCGERVESYLFCNRGESVCIFTSPLSSVAKLQRRLHVLLEKKF
jgi:hypothetical protein